MNITNIEKWKFLVIDKLRNQSCFETVKQLPIDMTKSECIVTAATVSPKLFITDFQKNKQEQHR